MTGHRASEGAGAEPGNAADREAPRDASGRSLLVALGSTSPAKRRAVEEALEGALGRLDAREVEVRATSAASGVPDQPWGEDETRRGALNRARAAFELEPRAHLAVGIEAGVAEEPGWPLWTFAWVVALDRSGVVGAARSATFGVPDALAQGVRNGLELGDALDRAYDLERAKDGPGAVGVLTGGLIDRPELYRTAVLLALMPWLGPDAPDPRLSER